MKLELSEEEIRVILLWNLSCEDHSLEHWREFCLSCPVKDKCNKLKNKLFEGKKNE
uniref:Uncharacterized protein n=1 Tax=viral metagenome TaxID=1070528 RepID=A0A6M3XDN3_9ZZZZ